MGAGSPRFTLHLMIAASILFAFLDIDSPFVLILFIAFYIRFLLFFYDQMYFYVPLLSPKGIFVPGWLMRALFAPHLAQEYVAA